MFIGWIPILLLVSYRAYGFHYGRFGVGPKCKADTMDNWSYRGRNGPRQWSYNFPTCYGYEQSPIDIATDDVIFAESLEMLEMENYHKPVTRATIDNNGRTIEVTPRDGIERTIHVDDDTYRLEQLHFHWGSTPFRGAEHSFDGQHCSMEMHLVHRNAINETAVVAVFFRESMKYTPELQVIIDRFPHVMFRNMSTELKSKLHLNKLLPENPASFYRYYGSLTTPNCDEGVTWSLLIKALPVGKKQMKEFRKLYSSRETDEKCKLSDNFRPVQQLNQRKVLVSQ